MTIFNIENAEIITRSANFYADKITYSVYFDGEYKYEFTIEEIENPSFFKNGELRETTPIIFKELLKLKLYDFVEKHFKNQQTED